MNLGRTEYTRLVKSEARLRKAEKLIERCFLEIRGSVEESIGLEEAMNNPLSYYGEILNDLKDFLSTFSNREITKGRTYDFYLTCTKRMEGEFDCPSIYITPYLYYLYITNTEC